MVCDITKDLVRFLFLVFFFFLILVRELGIFLGFGETNFQVCVFRNDNILSDQGSKILRRLLSGNFSFLQGLVFANQGKSTEFTKKKKPNTFSSTQYLYFLSSSFISGAQFEMLKSP